MAEYRTPLPGILAALLEGGVNRILAMDRNAPQRLQRLDNRMLQLDIEGLGITLYFAFSDHRVEVGTRSDAEPDTVISGSPTALFAMAAPEGAGNWGSDASRVSISGDATLARDLERVFSQLEPDWEGSLSRIFGDVWGHQVATGLRSGAAQAKETVSTAGEMVDEYHKSAQGPVILSNEFAEFADAVDELDETSERIAERLGEIEKAPEEQA